MFLSTLLGVCVFNLNMAFANPLLEPWKGPYGGLPDFSRVQVTDFKPALLDAVAKNKAEIQAIVDNPAPPTFENTIEALERAGQDLNQVYTYYGVWGGSRVTPDFQAMDAEMSPILSAESDEIVQNPELFRKIEAVYNARASLTPEQQRITWVYYDSYIMQGARLTPQQKKEVTEINQRLSVLSTEFAQKMLADEEDTYLLLHDEKDLAGLPEDFVKSTKAAAEERNMQGWLIQNNRTAMEPFLTYSSHRDLREKAFRLWSSRGDIDPAQNNNQIAAEILQLRARRSQIFGFPTYAHWSLTNTMAKDPQAAMDLMEKVWKSAVERVREEVQEMQALVVAEGGPFKIQPWDYRYYMEKVRKAKYDLDLSEVTPYLQLENVKQAMFWMAEKLYKLKFDKIDNVSVYADLMSVYQVSREGKVIGILYFDPFARKGKRSGAWMSSFRKQQKMDGAPVIPIVANTLNIMRPEAGQPALVTWSDANTLFHEFGHGLHGLLSNVTYPTLSGTATVRDQVELPSQFHENYLTTPEILKFFVDKDGKSMPPLLVEKLLKSQVFNQGFETVELLSSALVDMKLHLAGGTVSDPKDFERELLKDIGMPIEMIPRHRVAHFAHIFSGEGYAAGYYSYFWSQVLDKDAFAAFVESGDVFNPQIAQKFEAAVLSAGNSVDATEGYQGFRGREADCTALLESKGFPVQ